MSNLHQAVRSEIQYKKPLVVQGFIRSYCSIPDIANICLMFYDEVIHWEIHQDEMSNGQRPQSAPFICEGVRFQCSMNPDAKHKNTSGFAVVDLKAELSAHVQSIKFFFTMYCKQKDCTFQRVVQLRNTNNSSNSNWVSEPFWLIIDCKQFEQINLNHYIDVLQIKYRKSARDKHADYNKPIKIPEAYQFEWNIDKQLLTQFAEANYGQFFVSDVFDKVNQNFCLRVYPTSYDHVHLVPVILRMPYNIDSIELHVTVRNSVNEEVKNSIIKLSQNATSLFHCDSIMDAVSSECLSTLQELRIVVDVMIISFEPAAISASAMNECQRCVAPFVEHVYMTYNIIPSPMAQSRMSDTNEEVHEYACPFCHQRPSKSVCFNEHLATCVEKTKVLRVLDDDSD